MKLYRKLRARRALTLFKDVPLRTTRALSLYKVYGDSALLVLNRTPLNSFNALLSRRYAVDHKYEFFNILSIATLVTIRTMCMDSSRTESKVNVKRTAVQLKVYRSSCVFTFYYRLIVRITFSQLNGSTIKPAIKRSTRSFTTWL